MRMNCMKIRIWIRLEHIGFCWWLGQRHLPHHQVTSLSFRESLCCPLLYNLCRRVCVCVSWKTQRFSDVHRIISFPRRWCNLRKLQKTVQNVYWKDSFQTLKKWKTVKNKLLEDSNELVQLSCQCWYCLPRSVGMSIVRILPCSKEPRWVENIWMSPAGY